ncbi:MAG: hypothetical protein ABFD97_12800 [Syntrophobacter sp.]
MYSSGHRGRMRDHAVLLTKMFQDLPKIPLVKIMADLNVSENTARRWVDSFSVILPIRLVNGVVIVEKNQNP